MATNRDPLLKPDSIASHEFATSFRGYDPNEVRRFLAQIAEAVRVDNSGPAEDPEVVKALVAERDELRRKVAQLERAASSNESDDATYVTSLITSETTAVIENAREAAATIMRKAEAEASRRRREVKELEQRVDAEIQNKRQTVAEDTAKVRRETQSEVNTLRNEADEETKALRAKADEYAATTRAQAQEILRSRTAEAESFYETRTRKTEEATAAMRAEAEEETTTMRRNAEDAAAKMRREAEEETLALRRRTDEEIKALRANAEAEAEDLRTAAQARVDELNVEADKIKAESENAANIARAEATAAADLATREVRDEARMMVAEARAVREKILTDLIRRRRAARQQIDQARAARDRLVRSLEERKRELDEATEELNRAVPEARAAMDRVPAPVADDDAEVAAALSALDKARPERGRSFADLGETPETEDYARRLANDEPFRAPEPVEAEHATAKESDDDGDEPAETEVDTSEASDEEATEAYRERSGDRRSEIRSYDDDAGGRDPRGGDAHTGEDSYRDEADEEPAPSTPPPPVLADAITTDDRGFESSDDRSSDHEDADGFDGFNAEDDSVGLEADQADVDRPNGDQSGDDIHVESIADDPEEEVREDERTRLFDTAIGNMDDEPEVTRSAGLFGLGAAAAAPAVAVGSLFNRSEDDVVDHSGSTSDFSEGVSSSDGDGASVSEQKAEALDRIAPDLKRQLKRALADDQSDLLDSVRRGGREASVSDLPAQERQVARFADALESSLRASANAGASAAGGRIWPGLVDGLVAETAHKLVDDVRSVVIAAVNADGGQDSALEAIRSHYRDVRTNRLGRLVDQSLADAFGLGLENGSEAGR